MTFDKYCSFIVCWWQHDSVEEVVRCTGMDSRRVSNVAAFLRRKGVQLKSMHAKRVGTKKLHRLTLEHWAELKRLGTVEASKAEADRRRSR